MLNAVALPLFLSAGGLVVAANAIYYWMIHRVNASGQLEKEIGWEIQLPVKGWKIFTSHKRIFPGSRLPQISQICFLVGAALMLCSGWVYLLATFLARS